MQAARNTTNPLLTHSCNSKSWQLTMLLLSQQGLFSISRDHTTVRKEPVWKTGSNARRRYGGVDNSNCMAILPVMAAEAAAAGVSAANVAADVAANIHTISFQLDRAADNCHVARMVCGLVVAGMPFSYNYTMAQCVGPARLTHPRPQTLTSWLMDTKDGSLIFCDDGKHYGRTYSFERVGVDDVLTMQVDLNTGTLMYWRNGLPYGPGFSNRGLGSASHMGIRGPVQWAVTIPYQRDSVRIVPTPVLAPHPGVVSSD
jgi:hypothetical protein